MKRFTGSFASYFCEAIFPSCIHRKSRMSASDHADADVRVRNHSTLYTRFCADSVECCPWPGNEDLSIIGSYELLGDNTKVGQVYLAEISPAAPADLALDPAEICDISEISSETYNNPDITVDMSAEAARALPRASRTAGAPYFTVRDRMNTPAVLDLKWQPAPAPAPVSASSSAPLSTSGAGAFVGPQFAAAYEDGSVRCYAVSRLTTSAVVTGASTADAAAAAAPAAENDPESRRAADDSAVEPQPRLMKEKWRCRVSDSGSLALSLDWGLLPERPADNDGDDNYDDYDNDDADTRTSASVPAVLASVIAASYSDGRLAVLDVCSPGGGVRARHYWAGHDAEAWITCLDAHPAAPSGSWVYSGADDTLLKVWDTRLLPLQPLPDAGADASGACAGSDVEFEPLEPSRRVPAVATLRAHSAGVCSLRCHPVNPHLLASGSYDKTLLLWDKRNLSAPLTSWESDGGVWRLKWFPAPAAVSTVTTAGAGAAAGVAGGYGTAKSSALCVVNMYNGMHVLAVDNLFSPVPGTTDGTATAGLDDESALLAHIATEGALQAAPQVRVLSSYKQCGRKTILYGGDWVAGDTARYFAPGVASPHTADGLGPSLIAACSFYNKRATLWSPTE
jgi:WD40 repeat protein